MVKSVSRFSGLSAICLIVTLIVPIIQCLPVENELNSSDRFKRNVGLAGPGSQTISTSTASSKATASGSAITPFTFPFLNSGPFYSGGGGGSSGLSGLLEGKLIDALIPTLYKTFTPLAGYLQKGVLSPVGDTLGGTTEGLTGGLTGLVGGVGSALNGLLGNGGALSQPSFGGYQFNPSTLYALLASKLGSNVQTAATSTANSQAASFIQ